MNYRKKAMLMAGALLCLNLSIYSQSISLKMSNVSVKKAMTELQTKSGYSFVYIAGDVDTDRTVSINASQLKDAVAQILKGQNVSYEIQGKNIVIKKGSQQTASSEKKKKVTGTVKDANGEPVIGATVVEKGTTNGTVTDFDGNFVLEEATEGALLEVSYIGYKPQHLTIVSGSPLAITLNEDTEVLEEVIVVGFGTQKKVNLTGAVASVDSKLLDNRPVQNVSSALQGLMPGVTITSNGGRPGMDGSTIRVRGVGTLNNASPYVLVDGVETGTLDSVDPNDIESISVLKDASSAAIYGAKASNGVILITTKRGKKGKPTIKYSGNIGIQKPTELVDRLSSYDYARLLNQSMEEAGVEPRFTSDEIQKFKDGTDPNYPNTQWYDLILQSGFQHKHNVNISGGSENFSYMASLGYLGQTGILPNAEREQFNARTNLDTKLSKRIAFRLNMSYINNDYSDPTGCYAGGGSGIIFTEANRMAPWIVGRYEDGTYGTISDGNPLAWLDLNQTQNRANTNFTGTAALDVDILEGLKFTVSGTYVDNNQRFDEFIKYIRYNESLESEPNRLTVINYKWQRKYFDALLNYDKKIEKHSIKALLGWHAEKYDYTEDKSFRKNFPTNDLTDMNAGEEKTQTNGGYTRELAMLSYFGRINYDYAGKYLFEANLRADASSRFAPENRWGYFPSFSGAWRISEEGFMDKIRNVISDMKIRASWGLLGNQDALSDYYPWLPVYSVDTSYPFNNELNSGYKLGGYKLSTITWEKAQTWGIGLDLTIHNNLNLSIDYYNRKTTGIIMDMPVPNEFALGGYKDNIGAMRNSGVELSFNYRRNWNDWMFSVSGNFSYNKNEVLNLGGGVTTMVDPNNSNMRRVVGEPLNSYYMYATDGFFNSDEEAEAWMNQYAGKDGYPFGSKKFKGGDLIFKDVNGDGKMTQDDRTLCGSRDPKFTYGLNLYGEYKGLDLSLMFNGAAGHKMLLNDNAIGSFIGDGTHPASVWLDAWSENNKDGKMPRVAYATESPSSFQNVVSDFYLNNASYLRLKNLQIGYSIPLKYLSKVGLSGLRFYYSIENVFTISNMLIKVDPEINSETGNDYPLLRTNSFGVNITF